MRFVVVSNLLGFCAALIGLAFLDLGWIAAAAIFVLSGPAGAALAIAASLVQQPVEGEPSLEAAVQRRIA